MAHNLFNSLRELKLSSGKSGRYYALAALEAAGLGNISRLPVSIRVILEAVLRNCDGKKITEAHVRQLAGWKPVDARSDEIPFIVARIVLQDFTGVPLLADLAAMRSAAQKLGKDPRVIEPLVPVDMVVDHSVQVDHYNTPRALELNMMLEFDRNMERYQFLKWGMQAFDTFKVVPPGIGIVHQVNLEYLARGVLSKDGIYFPDTLVGTDSHTTMINGIGVVGWGVGGIEAEAGMLGQPVYFLTPDVVGVNLTGKLPLGVTATDLVLAVTEKLRSTKVVGKFVEFFGEGAASLSVPDRATIANMAPEYGATMGFFPVDEATCSYFRATGRSNEEIDAFRSYYEAQGMFGIPAAGQCDYSQVIEINLASINPCIAGPKRPQDRIEVSALKETFASLLEKPSTASGYGKSAGELGKRFAISRPIEANLQEVERNRVEMLETANGSTNGETLSHGDVLIAAITSCTNTSNPGVLLAAALLARKAVEKGLRVNPRIKTSLAPGSRVVTRYLENAGLQSSLDALGFRLVGYGCTTCIGNSGPLESHIEEAIVRNDVIAAAVLSGNRNFEARIHQNIKANFLMSPPLVVAFAIAGTVNIDMDREPLGFDSQKNPVYLRDIWPSSEEIDRVMAFATDPEVYRERYADFTKDNPLWEKVQSSSGAIYQWNPDSTYIQEPPFFKAQQPEIEDIAGAHALGIFGDSVTTDHISPAGGIKVSSPAGKYLTGHGVAIADFNSYGSRRGNHEVMMRGTFANVRIRNLMIPGSEGGITLYRGEQTSIYDAAMKYVSENIPTVIFAGEEYGTGSSRDWAAKGTRLLGVKAVIASSFERIHRSNLVGMGVLPCQFKDGMNARSLNLDGSETFDILLGGEIAPQRDVTLSICRKDGSRENVPLLLRIDTPIEVEYYRKGGILPYVLEMLLD
ncbi:MAG: aconitate hydratase AcnA [Burkholderiales bacterium]|nr:aconitate hydratase AcnA [Burkholderiales bacterium]